MKPRTNTLYSLLIQKTPADSSTILTELFKRTNQVSINKPLLPKEVHTSSTKTKENIIDILATHLTEKIKEKSLSYKRTNQWRSQGVCRKHFDMETKFDKADYIIPEQVNKVFKYGEK